MWHALSFFPVTCEGIPGGCFKGDININLLRKSETEMIVNIQDSIQEKDQKRWTMR